MKLPPLSAVAPPIRGAASATSTVAPASAAVAAAARGRARGDGSRPPRLGRGRGRGQPPAAATDDDHVEIEYRCHRSSKCAACYSARYRRCPLTVFVTDGGRASALS